MTVDLVGHYLAAIDVSVGPTSSGVGGVHGNGQMRLAGASRSL